MAGKAEMGLGDGLLSPITFTGGYQRSAEITVGVLLGPKLSVTSLNYHITYMEPCSVINYNCSVVPFDSVSNAS